MYLIFWSNLLILISNNDSKCQLTFTGLSNGVHLFGPPVDLDPYIDLDPQLTWLVNDL